MDVGQQWRVNVAVMGGIRRGVLMGEGEVNMTLGRMMTLPALWRGFDKLSLPDDGLGRPGWWVEKEWEERN